MELPSAAASGVVAFEVQAICDVDGCLPLVFSPRPVTNRSLVGMSAGDDPAGDDEEVINPPPWEREKDRAEPSGMIERFPLARDEPDHPRPPLRRFWRDFIHRSKK